MLERAGAWVMDRGFVSRLHDIHAAGVRPALAAEFDIQKVRCGEGISLRAAADDGGDVLLPATLTGASRARRVNQSKEDTNGISDI